MQHYTEFRKFAYEKIGKEKAEQLKAVIIDEKLRTRKDVVDLIIREEQFMSELKENIIEDILTRIREEPYDKITEHQKTNTRKESRFKFKIREIYKKNRILIEKLKRYQISANIEDHMYEFNSLIYALKQTQKFSENQISEMIQFKMNENEKMSKYLTRFGTRFNIQFELLKFNEKENKWRNVREQHNKTGQNIIKLATINDHIILNEDVEGVSSFALKNYKEIDEKCKKKTDEEKLMIYRKRNEKFQILKSRAKIKSYQLLELVIDNNTSENSIKIG